jgi:hypothetical protein
MFAETLLGKPPTSSVTSHPQVIHGGDNTPNS